MSPLPPFSAWSGRRAAMRWVERLDPSRAATALAIAQAHGLPELIGRLLAARGADAATLLPLSRSVAASSPARPGKPAGHGAGSRALRRAPSSAARAHRHFRRLRRRRRGLGGADPALPARPRPDRRQPTSPTASAKATARRLRRSPGLSRRAHGSSSPSIAAPPPARPSRPPTMRRRNHCHRPSPGRRGASACLRGAQPQPAGRSLRPGTSRGGRRGVSVPGRHDAGAPPRRLLSRERRARPARPARPRGARHRVRRGAAQRREPRASWPKGCRSCGSGTMPDCARWPMWRASMRRRPATRSASSSVRASMPAAGSGPPASAPSCSPATMTARRAPSRASSKRSTLSARRSRSACLAKPSSAAERALEAGRPFIWLGADGWHKGLLGLVAGRIAERFHLPTFVTAWSLTGRAPGSARSIASVDLGARGQGRRA